MIVCLYLLSRVISSDYASIFDYSNYIYYTIGYYIAKKKDVLLSWKQPLIPYLTALMVFLLMSFFWYRNSAAIPSQYNEVFKSVLSSKPCIYGTAVIGSFFSLMHFYIWGGKLVIVSRKRNIGDLCYSSDYCSYSRVDSYCIY